MIAQNNSQENNVNTSSTTRDLDHRQNLKAFEEALVWIKQDKKPSSGKQYSLSDSSFSRGDDSPQILTFIEGKKLSFKNMSQYKLTFSEDDSPKDMFAAFQQAKSYIQ